MTKYVPYLQMYKKVGEPFAVTSPKSKKSEAIRLGKYYAKPTREEQKGDALAVFKFEYVREVKERKPKTRKAKSHIKSTKSNASFGLFRPMLWGKK